MERQRLLSMLKAIKQITRKVHKWLAKELFIYTPYTILCTIGGLYVFDVVEKNSSDKYKIILSAILLSATISALSLRASSSCDDNDKKKTFYFAGERLFHATILLIGALALKYSADSIEKIKLFSEIILPIKVALVLPEFICFFYGLIFITISLKTLNRMLFKGHEAPLDR